jgi:hypothetical protein
MPPPLRTICPANWLKLPPSLPSSCRKELFTLQPAARIEIERVGELKGRRAEIGEAQRVCGAGRRVKSIRRAARLTSGVVRSTVIIFEGALVMSAALAMVGTPLTQLKASPQFPLVGAVQMDCAMSGTACEESGTGEQ